jgi:opacity protein-like surface antigen
MKTVATGALLSVLISSAAFAQPLTPTAAAGGEDQPQTIVGGPHEGRSIVSGWFVSPTFGTTGWGGALEYSPGLRGGIYLNQRLAIGLAVNGLANGDSHLGANGGGAFGTYGGLLLQYVVQSNRLAHVTFESTIGDGHWCASDDNHDCAGKRFIVFEPAANLELNVARHVRFTTGLGYRFAVAGSGDGPSSRDMSSLVVRSGLIFGSF